MNHKRYSVKLNNNKWFVLLMFWITLIFQLTAMADIWSIRSFGRAVNAASLVVFVLCAARIILVDSFHKKIWFYYLIPGILIFTGSVINICSNIVENFELIGYLSFIIPWVVYLIIPGFLKRGIISCERLWSYFYYFMLLSTSLGLLEYFLAFQHHFLKLNILETSNGIFLRGYFSIFHMLPDGTPHYRFYANFIEPGTLSMWLLPVMAYAFFYARYIGLLVFIIGMIFSASLGGLMSLLLLGFLAIYIKFREKLNNQMIVIF